MTFVYRLKCAKILLEICCKLFALVTTLLCPFFTVNSRAQC